MTVSPPRRGSCSVALLILGIAAFAITWGSHQTYLSWRNSEPTEITYEDYLAEQPDAEWLTLTGVAFDYFNSAHEEMEDTGRITKVYVPVIPVAEPEGEPAATRVLIEIDDPETIAFYEAIPDEPEAAAAYLLENRGAWDVGRVSGILRFGIESTDKERTDLRGVVADLAPDFALIVKDEEPHGVVPGLLAILAGVVVLGLGLLAGKGSRGRNRRTGRTGRRRRSDDEEEGADDR